MRIAFYAPLKPPDHPVPSGDRRVGREFMRALAQSGHDVELASRFRSWEGAGESTRQERLERLGASVAAELIAGYGAAPASRPQLWFTYHLYHKAPDWIGPRVADRLRIPYVVAEASSAAKQSAGPWATGHRAVAAALGRADTAIQLNIDDQEGVLPLLKSPARLASFLPFLDTAPYAAAQPEREALAETFKLVPGQPWLLAVAMMRPGAKLESYRVLAAALSRLLDLDWQLMIVGDGPARLEVEAAFKALPPERVRILGALPSDRLPAIYASADLYVWPAIHEAYGMAFLEAQAAGLPVVAGRERGVPSVMREGKTGLLAAAGDPVSFAAAVRLLLTNEPRRQAMSREARRIIRTEHDIQAVARRLDMLVERLVREARR
jgi:hypothetical protein